MSAYSSGLIHITWVYQHNLYDDSDMASKLSGIKAVIITPSNLELLLKHYSFNDYQEFYEQNFLNIPDFEIDGATLFEEYNDNTDQDDGE